MCNTSFYDNDETEGHGRVPINNGAPPVHKNSLKMPTRPFAQQVPPLSQPTRALRNSIAASRRGKN
eukprot:CAMPEP_0114315516 /NCGR_PEP_ID=MMETSP0059-20121206/22565_1 /TAXON_ID=36894 /ORGANISM="Pyramimonas parkeae, Strain CCMP726" /LENGTH=65 /DNA_ID=CAMNT_0001441093 /DNA_START=90 /DNA_END=284 /DNA_ORIENTATION=-